MSNDKIIHDLQKQLKMNMSKAVKFAEKNTKRNSLGQVVLSSDDECEWEAITNIFQKAIKRKNLSKNQIGDIADCIINRD